MSETTPLQSLRKSRAADLSWAATPNRAARTANGRRAADARFLELANGDPKRAESLRKAHYKAMAIKSLERRQALAAARKVAELDADVASGGDNGPPNEVGPRKKITSEGPDTIITDSHHHEAGGYG